MVLLARVAWKSSPPCYSVLNSEIASSVFARRTLLYRTAFRSQWRLSSSHSLAFTTLLTSRPDAVEPHHFVDHLPQLERSQDVAIFLISSSFASWTDPQSPFLADSIRQMRRNHGTEKTSFTSLVAVVDRLPASSLDHNFHRVRTCKFDGLSLHLGKVDRVNSDLLLDGFESRHPAEDVDLPGVITIVRRDASAGPAQVPIQHSVQIPLANTIFSTGRLSTMYKTKWIVSRDEVIPVAHHYLNQQRVDITTPKWSCQSTISAPLIALTPTRKVLSSMGNIVRQIEGMEGDEKGVPASSELEKAVARYSETFSPRSGRLSVWACLYSPENSSSGLPPGSDSDKVSNMLASCLPDGARLHKVLSGGGGWGAKQGLLSLDPEQSFVESKSESGSWDDEGYPWKSGESDIVKAGDSVQFFASAPEPQSEDVKSETPITPVVCAFGSVEEQVMDSTETEVLDRELILDDHDEEPPLVSVFPQFFGALSEKGISIKYELLSSEKAPVTIGQTKLDVPGSSISFLNHASHHD